MGAGRWGWAGGRGESGRRVLPCWPVTQWTRAEASATPVRVAGPGALEPIVPSSGLPKARGSPTHQTISVQFTGSETLKGDGFCGLPDVAIPEKGASGPELLLWRNPSLSPKSPFSGPGPWPSAEWTCDQPHGGCLQREGQGEEGAGRRSGPAGGPSLPPSLMCLLSSLECWPGVHGVRCPGGRGETPVQVLQAEVPGQQSSVPGHSVARLPTGVVPS